MIHNSVDTYLPDDRRTTLDERKTSVFYDFFVVRRSSFVKRVKLISQLYAPALRFYPLFAITLLYDNIHTCQFTGSRPIWPNG